MNNRQYCRSSSYSRYAPPPKVIQTLSEDVKRQVDGLSDTIRKFEGLNKSLIIESKLNWSTFCSLCQRRLNDINLPRKEERGCQTENDLTVKLYPKVLELGCSIAAPGLSTDDDIKGLQSPGVDNCSSVAVELKNKSERHESYETLPTEKLYLVNQQEEDTKEELQWPQWTEDTPGKEQGAKEKTAQDLETVTENLEKIFTKRPPEIQKLEDEIVEREREIRQLTTTNEKLTIEVGTLNTERRSLRKNGKQQPILDSDNLEATQNINEEKMESLHEIKQMSSKLDHVQQTLRRIKDHGLSKKEDTITMGKVELGRDISKLEDEKRVLSEKNDNSEKALRLDKLKSEQEDMTRDMKTLREKNEQLQNSLSVLEGKKAKMQSDTEQQMTDLREHNITLSSTNLALKGQISMAMDMLDNLTSDKGKLTSDLENLQQDKLRIQQELVGKIPKLKEKKENADSEKENLRKKLDAHKAGLDKLKSEQDDMTRDMKTLREKNEQLQNSLSVLEGEKAKIQTDTEQQMTDLRKHNTTFSSTISVLERQISVTMGILENLTSDKAKLTSDKAKLTSGMESQQQDKLHIQQELEGKMAKLEEKKEKAHSEMENLRKTLGLKEEENRKLKMEIFELKTPKKKSIVLGMRYHSSIGKIMVDMVTRDLTKRLERVMDMTEFDLTIKPYQKASETPKGPMVVLCLNNKIVEANIRAALTGIEVCSDVTVVVLYHTSEDNLSHLTPANRRVSAKELKELGAILDMAFSSDSGLYDCDLNTTAIDKLATILKKC